MVEEGIPNFNPVPQYGTSIIKNYNYQVSILVDDSREMKELVFLSSSLSQRA